MGTTSDEPAAYERFAELLHGQSWAMFMASVGGEVVGYAAAQDHGPHLRSGTSTGPPGCTTCTCVRPPGGAVVDGR
jgi:hypothetical protein